MARHGRNFAEFESFVEAHGRQLLRVAALLGGGPAEAEDLLQETLYRVAMRWDRVRDPVAFSRRVLANLVTDRHRRAARRPTRALGAPAEGGIDPRPGDLHAAADVRPALLAALASLPPRQRSVVVLRYFDDRSEQDVAGLLGISVGTVKSTASRALAALEDRPELTALFESSPHH